MRYRRDTNQSINQSINQSYSETRPPMEQSDYNSTGRDVHTHTVQNHTHILQCQRNKPIDNKGEKVTANSGMITLTDSMLQ